MTPSARSVVPPFHVMEVLRAAAVRQRSHGDMILLCVGQPSTPAPRPVLDAVHEAVDAEQLGYTEGNGIPALRETIARHYEATYSVTIDPDEVVVSSGSSGGFSTLLLTAFDAGDRIVMARPGYPAYRNTLHALGLDVVEIQCGERTRFQPTVGQLEELVASDGPVAGLIIASPANPTGTIIDPDELAALADWCRQHNVLLISDEIYHGISYGRPTHTAWEFSRDAVVLGSLSKFWSMTGWRVGWNLLPEHLRRPFDVLQTNLSICAPAVSQHGAVAAFSPEATAQLQRHVERYAVNRQVLLDRLPALGITSFAPPDGAFYAYCDISHLTSDSVAWCADLLEATGVALAPGIDFDPVDGGRFVRLSFCGDTAALHEGLDRIQAYV
ncbi:aminotransferase class I/II-fold pyridoxal phosphate-dependent enzyme [Rudaeicoccus suwonensis]|uniref:Aminotransferase n=1 Tax=Rudaeicoccus suwonensis TaxID=657409 RepID=A0A561EA78_9MICO|nr:aminotransferase class I/II-fold pyridoxal phosphate-dependent enzyme [Rudaeicoccus suwonensis]TWE12487.1 aspartate/methionine/tyrosine aminotransferase [Rudaeicoccus suwonensis]